MTAVGLPVALAGDGLQVPCADGTLRPYLSFDAATSTGALPGVLEAVGAFVPWYSGVYCGAGYKSQASALAYEGARLAALAFAGRGPDSGDVAVIRQNTTDAISYLACRLGLSRGDVVVTTVAEHHANLLPWARAATCRYVECGPDGTFTAEDIAAAVDRRPVPRLLAVTGACHVTGWLPPLPDIIAAAHARGVPVLVDAAQLAAHRPLPGQADFLAWSGHKMYAPFGTGVLVGPRRVLAAGDRSAAGGAGSGPGWGAAGGTVPFLPEEEGSPNVIGAVALQAAIGAVEDIGWPSLARHDRRIAASLRRGLAAIPGVRLLGPGPDTQTLPIAAFTVDGVPNALVAARLAAEDAIAVRHGDLQARPCLARLLGAGPARAPDQPGHGHRGATPGAVRASAGISTSEQDVARLLSAVARLAAGVPATGYHRDPSTGDFYPAMTASRSR
jgi:selenocysteine lyase/cysteine desulfurase